jgi:hypothetical protein
MPTDDPLHFLCPAAARAVYQILFVFRTWSAPAASVFPARPVHDLSRIKRLSSFAPATPSQLHFAHN